MLRFLKEGFLHLTQVQQQMMLKVLFIKFEDSLTYLLVRVESTLLYLRLRECVVHFFHVSAQNALKWDLNYTICVED